jgi:hypothetical protein
MTDTPTPCLVATPCGTLRAAQMKSAADALMGIVRDEEGARECLLALDASLARCSDLRPVPSTPSGSE